MLTQRDISAIWLFHTFDFLRSGQLARLLSCSNPIARRITRRLGRFGYLKELKREHNRAEKAFTLSSKGREYIARESNVRVKDLPSTGKVPDCTSIHWRHYLATNDCRIAFYLALLEHPRVGCHENIGEFHRHKPRKRRSTEKYRLWAELDAGEGRGTRFFQPDGGLILYNKDMPDFPALNCLEMDMGSQDIKTKIHNKFMVYKLFEEKGCHFRQFGCVVMRCLFVLNDRKESNRMARMQARLREMCRELGDMEPLNPIKPPGQRSPASFVHMFRFTHLEEIRGLPRVGDIFDAPIWQDWSGNAVSLFSLKETLEEERAA